jgi:ArsR family transcriptional regulator, arsenate/arsenite/antimonite-responsive transcriptional repressor
MEDIDAVRAFGALANPHRLSVFRALVRVGPEGLPAGELAKSAGIAASTLTFHCKELERAGLIHCWREGRFIRSAIHVANMRDLISYLTEDCCAGRPDLCGAAAVEQSPAACCPPPRKQARAKS